MKANECGKALLNIENVKHLPVYLINKKSVKHPI